MRRHATSTRMSTAARMAASCHRARAVLELPRSERSKSSHVFASASRRTRPPVRSAMERSSAALSRVARYSAGYGTLTAACTLPARAAPSAPPARANAMFARYAPASCASNSPLNRPGPTWRSGRSRTAPPGVTSRASARVSAENPPCACSRVSTSMNARSPSTRVETLTSCGMAGRMTQRIICSLKARNRPHCVHAGPQRPPMSLAKAIERPSP